MFDPQNIAQVAEVLRSFDATGIGRCIRILADLAETGLETVKNPAGDLTATGPKKDPFLTPSQACEYLQVSLDTLTKFRKRYDLDSIGSGRNRRYRFSEIERVAELRKSE